MNDEMTLTKYTEATWIHGTTGQELAYVTLPPGAKVIKEKRFSEEQEHDYMLFEGNRYRVERDGRST